jgi:hypothetical protein
MAIETGSDKPECLCKCGHKEFDHRDDGTCVWDSNTGGPHVCPCTGFVPARPEDARG